jgi:hypothetical protein
MKNKWFTSIGVLLVFWLVLTGCASTGAVTPEEPTPGTIPQPAGDTANTDEKTIVITGFELESWGLAGRMPDIGYLRHPGDQNWVAYCKVEPGVNYKDGTITLWLWVNDGKDVGTRWTGIGEYELLLEIKPAQTAGKSAMAFVKVDTNGNVENVAIKEAETTFKWSEFDFFFEY